MKRIILAVLIGLSLLSVYAKDDIRIYGAVSGNTCATTHGIVSVDEISVAEGSNIVVWCTLKANEDKDDIVLLIEDVSVFSVLVNKNDTIRLTGMYILDPETYHPTENQFLGVPYWEELKAGSEYPFVLGFKGDIKRGDEKLSILFFEDEEETEGDDYAHEVKEGEIIPVSAEEEIEVDDVVLVINEEENQEPAEEGSAKLSLLKLPDLVIDNPMYAKKSTWRMGRTTSRVKLRNEPSLSGTYDKIVDLGDAVIYDRAAAENGFLKVTLIETAETGYIKSEYIKDEVTIEKPSYGSLKNIRYSDVNADPIVEVYNDSDKSINFHIGKDVFTLKPKEEKKITLKHGSVVIMARAFGVEPYISMEEVSKGGVYSWKFFISKTKE